MSINLFGRLHGTLYEVPHAIEGRGNGPLKHVMERCALASGDMFSSVPAGADVYIMKHIIHDWPDDLCVKILTACRKGVNPAGKLLVVDKRHSAWERLLSGQVP